MRSEIAMDKTLNITKSSEIKGEFYAHGNPDRWVCLCKAWHKDEDWMKSTKAMEIVNAGCLVQVTTQQGENLAEALTFIPDVEIVYLENIPVLAKIVKKDGDSQ